MTNSYLILVAPAPEKLRKWDVVSTWNDNGTVKIRKAQPSAGVAKKNLASDN
jgi:hypothetical protein